MSALSRQIQEAALLGDEAEWLRLRAIQRENGEILDAFASWYGRLFGFAPDYDLIEVERESPNVFVLYYDPYYYMVRCQSPRTYAVLRRADGGFDFEEI